MVVQVESHSQTFAGIDAKLGIDMVFTMLLVAAVVVADIGIGRQRVEKQEVFRLLGGVVVGVGEEELSKGLAVDKDTILTGTVVVAYGVVFAIDTGIVDAVLVEMGHRVKLCALDVAKTTVYRPRPHALRHLLVAGLCGVTAVGVEVVVGLVTELVTLYDVAIGIHFIIHLSLQRQCGAGYECEKQVSFLNHFYESF